MDDPYERVMRSRRAYRASPLPAAVPRKFGVGTLLVVSSAYAALFGLLRYLNTPGLGIASIALFLTAVGLGQLIFGQRAARIGSVIAGIFAFPAIAIASFLVTEGFHPRMLPDLVLSLFCLLICGAICGYVGGVAVAGVFLGMETADRILHRRSGEFVRAEVLDESPFRPETASPESGKDSV